MRREFHVRFCEGGGVRLPSATRRNVYVQSRRAGQRVLASLEAFLTRRLGLRINRAKSAVARPWERAFLGYSVTMHRDPRLKIAPGSVQRLKQKLRPLLRRGRGRSLRMLLRELAPILRGWMAYYRLTQVKAPLELLDAWLRRKLRAIRWKQWKKWRTRLRELVRLGLSRDCAAASACNGRGTWWNAGASHMNRALPNTLLQEWGLVTLTLEHRRLASNL
ncbi:MAG: hypothetical protein JXQ75_17060 [Phycisphaerae bacterium]|nr:hypothetical protein [Phycisphaerae bacterium]